MSQVDHMGEKQLPESSRASVTKSNCTATVDDAEAPVQKTGSQEAARDAYPEGGWEAWSTVAGAMAVQFCGFGYTTSFGVYQDYYQRVYLSTENASTISWIGSINAFIVIAAGIFVGRLYDRGYFYHILYGGSLLLSFSLFMLSLAKPNHYYQIMLSQGIGAGIGAGMMYVPSLAVVSQYFHKRRALAMTIVASGSSLGAVSHPLMLNNLLNKSDVGFAVATRANAGLISGLLLLSCLLMRTRIDPPKSPLSLWNAAQRFVKDGPYVFAATGMSLFITGYYFPIFYLQSDALKHGLSDTFSFYAIVILNACSFFGRLTPGFITHKLGVGQIIVVATFICAVLVACVVAVTNVTGFVIFGVIFGYCSGIYITLLAPMLASLTEDLSELGARMGAAFFLCGIGSLISTPIDGALLTSENIWWRPTVFSAIVTFGGCGCLFTSTILRARKHRLIEQQEMRATSENA